MEILQFRYFLAAARFQHMTHAAEALGIAQPALSQSVRRLEEELQVPLFERKNRSVQLTPEGEYLQKLLRPLISRIDSLPRELQEFRAERDQLIHLNLQAATSLVTGCIISYKKQRPEISFQLSQITQDSMLNDLTISTALPDEEILSGQESILREQIYLAVPRSSRYASQSSIDLMNVAREGFVSLSESKPVRSICDHFCNAAGFTPHVIFESDSLEAVRNLISAGLGIGFWTEYSWGALPKDDVKLLRVEKIDCHRDIVVGLTEKGREKASVLDFYHFLMSYAASRTGQTESTSAP